MPSLPRPVADGLLYHAVNRGNNRAAVFACAADFQAFLDALRQTQGRYPFRLFGAEVSVQATAAALSLPLFQRPRGRPRKGVNDLTPFISIYLSHPSLVGGLAFSSPELSRVES
jgi:hypothetical protein